MFDEEWYLSQNPDVLAAVKNGDLASGLLHYVRWGADEGRESLAYFEERFYVDLYEDVRAAVDAGLYGSGFEHYVRRGRFEGRRHNSRS